MTINNDVLCIGDINVGDGGTLNINGDVHCTGTIENSDGQLNIYGDLFTNSLTQDNPTFAGDLYISGNVTVYSTLTAGKCDGFSIEGNLTCDNFNFLADGFLNVHGNVSSLYLTVSQDGIDLQINGDLTTGTFTLGQGVSSSMEVDGRLYCSGGYILSPNASLTTGDQEIGGGVEVDANANLNINGTAYFYEGYTLASGASLTVGNMPTLTPVTTTGD
jgi:formylmethanofuran dehydrogenase subunit C